MISLDKYLWIVFYCAVVVSNVEISLTILKVQFSELYPSHRLYVSIRPKPGLCEDYKSGRLL